MISKSEALRVANERGLDLVLISPDSNPPVAKILDFSKFLYQERKKKSSAKAKSKKSELKEIKLGPSTGEGDVKRQIDRSREFIEEGNRVKVTVTMRGRENLYPDIAIEKIRRFEVELGDIAKLENEPKRTGRMIWTVFVAK